MSHPETSGEVYQVRSHHLTRLLGLSIAVSDASKEGHNAEALKVQDFVRQNLSTLLHRKDSGDQDSSEYAMDMIGRQAGQSHRFSQGLEDFYEKFLHMPDDHPVRIQSNVRDGICESCVIGDHCKTEMRENTEIERFIAYAKQAGCGDLQVQDSGGKTMSVTTNASTLRKVIRFVQEKKCAGVDANDFTEISILWNMYS